MVTKIPAASPSPNFHSGKIYVKKITSFTFQKFVSTSHVKLRSLNRILSVGILGTGICFQGSKMMGKFWGNCS